MISPDFIHAMGIIPIKLEQPIGLQLACVGSKSTITFRTARVEEYFDIANINYYNVILGTPFLWKLNITLDFTSPGVIHMGTTVVPRNIPPTTGEGVTKVVDCRSLPQKPPE